MKENWFKKYLGEFIGTFVLVLLGCGAVFVGVYTGAYGNLHALMWMWGFAVAIAVYIGASMSGAHYNPAVTIAMATFGKFPWSQVGQYIIAQFLGAFAAGGTLWAMFGNLAAPFEAANNIVRGQPGSQLSAMTMIPFSPNPAIIGTGADALTKVPAYAGALAEFVGTGLLVLMILVLLEKRNAMAPRPFLFPLTLGVAVFAIVGITAPLSMTSLNPARDLGPRLVAWLAGWGSIAFPGPANSWWITILMPIAGALFGALIFQTLVLPAYPKSEEETGKETHAAD